MLMGIGGFVLGFVFLLLGLSFYLCKMEIKIVESLSLEKISKTIQYSLVPPDDRIERKRFSGVESQRIRSAQGIPNVSLSPWMFLPLH
ncbi:hypothetical protein DUI87_06174 [Hirundo rustica rustica]|uniref:Uncharacterized protein n=1 Tax=Hirundo rustica rustica TaxID=333673 RepID=A0A3M0KUE5_HIRRU|nr:hypothetical protein DUI87_06174 [Hirundo rustica rustica]